MDGQEYLNQLSATTRSAKANKSGILQSKFFLVGAVGIIAFVLIMVVGALLGGNKQDESSLCVDLMLHLENTSEVIEEYQPKIKSSELRSYSASLWSIISDSDSKITTYLSEQYDMDSGDVDEEVEEVAVLQRDELDADLFDAKINGNLDRIYAHKMSYEITLFITEETKVLDATKNEDLQSFLTTSIDSLNNLAIKFDNFSETD